VRAARGVLRANAERLSDASFQIPLYVFAFLEMMILDTAFMSDWHIVVLSMAMVAGAPRRARQIVVHRIGKREAAVRHYARMKL
jgi:hypothetical protein